MTFINTLAQQQISVKDRRHLSPFSNGRRPLRHITHLAIHHTGVPADQSSEQLEHYWRTSHGWGTGGYHVYIRRTGQVEWNYTPEQITNGVGQHNHYLFHLCVAGKGQFTTRQDEVLFACIRYWCRELNIPYRNVLGHCEFSGHETNRCPGRDMEQLRNQLLHPSSPQSTPSSSSNALLNPLCYSERGTFYPQTTINIRSAPSTISAIVGQYHAGQRVHYDRVQVDALNGYVWISWIGQSGARRWMAIRERRNGQTGPMWGNIH